MISRSLYLSLICSLAMMDRSRVAVGVGFPFDHAKLLHNDLPDNELIKDQLIVILNDEFFGATDAFPIFTAMVNRFGGTVVKTYNHVFKGALIQGLPGNRVRRFLNNKMIGSAALNMRVSNKPVAAAQVEQGLFKGKEPWGLDRIDQTDLPLDNDYNFSYNGTGVTVFVLDTGMRFSHDEFEGRASCGLNLYDGAEDCEDYFGHGTHVGGIIGGKTYGVAKNVNIVAVKTLDKEGGGSSSDIIDGLEYVIERKKAEPNTPMVVNMSLGGSFFLPMNRAATKASEEGIVVVAAAGNSGTNACFQSPGTAAKAINVAATDIDDHRPGYSCYGICVDIFAPGSNIVSAGIKNDYAIAVMSGTSMASPHVAGAAALILQQNPSLTPDEVWSIIKSDALSGRVTKPGLLTPNLLLNIGRY